MRKIALGLIAATLVSAPAFAQSAAPAAPHLEFAFEELVTLSPAVDGGKTGYGGRRMIPITGGTFEGPGIKGTIVPGGWDWQLDRADGCTDVKADYMLRTDDGVLINVVNQGALCGPGPDGKPRPPRTEARLEAPIGKYGWLSQTAFIGTLDVAKGPKGEPAVRIRFYKAM